jgi:hypothetical protein
MALKDTLGAAIKDPTGFVTRATRARVQATVSRGLDRAYHQAEVKLYQSIEAVLGRILGTKVKSEWTALLSQGPLAERLDYLRSKFLRAWDAKQDFAHGLVHAERIAKMQADLHVARILLRQGKAHPERLVYARRWITRMLPRVTALAMEVQSTDLDDLLGRAEAEGQDETAEARQVG